MDAEEAIEVNEYSNKHRRWEYIPSTLDTSEDVGSLFGALAKAQGQFKPIKKAHENPFYHSNYADLADVIEATRAAMSENELCTIQGASVDGALKTVTIGTRLGHSSGQWVQQEITLPGTMRGGDDDDGNPTIRFDAQSVGSAITYGRRYGLSAILGIASEEDDDGNEASGKSDGKKGGQSSGGRAAMRKCPVCGKEAVIKGKDEYGGGYLCWAKQGGCGATWEDEALTKRTDNIPNEPDKKKDTPPAKDEKRQILIDEIGACMKAEHEGDPVFSDEEKAEVRILIPKTKTYKDLAAVRNTWAIKRDQRAPKSDDGQVGMF